MGNHARSGASEFYQAFSSTYTRPAAAQPQSTPRTQRRLPSSGIPRRSASAPRARPTAACQHATTSAKAAATRAPGSTATGRTHTRTRSSSSNNRNQQRQAKATTTGRRPAPQKLSARKAAKPVIAETEEDVGVVVTAALQQAELPVSAQRVVPQARGRTPHTSAAGAVESSTSLKGTAVQSDIHALRRTAATLTKDISASLGDLDRLAELASGANAALLTLPPSPPSAARGPTQVSPASAAAKAAAAAADDDIQQDSGGAQDSRFELEAAAESAASVTVPPADSTASVNAMLTRYGLTTPRAYQNVDPEDVEAGLANRRAALVHLLQDDAGNSSTAEATLRAQQPSLAAITAERATARQQADTQAVSAALEAAAAATASVQAVADAATGAGDSLLEPGPRQVSHLKLRSASLDMSTELAASPASRESVLAASPASPQKLHAAWNAKHSTADRPAGQPHARESARDSADITAAPADMAATRSRRGTAKFLAFGSAGLRSSGAGPPATQAGEQAEEQCPIHRADQSLPDGSVVFRGDTREAAGKAAAANWAGSERRGQVTRPVQSRGSAEVYRRVHGATAATASALSSSSATATARRLEDARAVKGWFDELQAARMAAKLAAVEARRAARAQKANEEAAAVLAAQEREAATPNAADTIACLPKSSVGTAFANRAATLAFHRAAPVTRPSSTRSALPAAGPQTPPGRPQVVQTAAPEQPAPPLFSPEHMQEYQARRIAVASDVRARDEQTTAQQSRSRARERRGTGYAGRRRTRSASPGQSRSSHARTGSAQPGYVDSVAVRGSAMESANGSVRQGRPRSRSVDPQARRAAPASAAGPDRVAKRAALATLKHILRTQPAAAGSLAQELGLEETASRAAGQAMQQNPVSYKALLAQYGRKEQHQSLRQLQTAAALDYVTTLGFGQEASHIMMTNTAGPRRSRSVGRSMRAEAGPSTTRHRRSRSVEHAREDWRR